MNTSNVYLLLIALLLCLYSCGNNQEPTEQEPATFVDLTGSWRLPEEPRTSDQNSSPVLSVIDATQLHLDFDGRAQGGEYSYDATNGNLRAFWGASFIGGKFDTQKQQILLTLNGKEFSFERVDTQVSEEVQYFYGMNQQPVEMGQQFKGQLKGTWLFSMPDTERKRNSESSRFRDIEKMYFADSNYVMRNDEGRRTKSGLYELTDTGFKSRQDRGFDFVLMEYAADTMVVRSRKGTVAFKLIRAREVEQQDMAEFYSGEGSIEVDFDAMPNYEDQSISRRAGTSGASYTDLREKLIADFEGFEQRINTSEYPENMKKNLIRQFKDVADNPSFDGFMKTLFTEYTKEDEAGILRSLRAFITRFDK